MTVGTGHPDWQGYSQWRSPNLINVSTGVGPLGVLLSPEAATQNFQSVLVQAFVAAGTAGFKLELQSYDYFQGAQGVWVTQRTWKIPATASLMVLLPIIGQAIRFKITNTSGVNTATVAVNAWGVNSPTVGPNEWLDDNSVNIQNVTMANGASQTLRLPMIVRGQAQVLLQNPAATAAGFNAGIFTYDEQGANVAAIASFHNIKDVVQSQVIIPNQPVSLVLTNSSGASVSGVYAALTCHGM